MVKNLALLVFSLCFTLLGCELVIRYLHEAWPFDSPLWVPDYLTTRDLPLRWRYPPGHGRNSLGLKNRELGPKNTGTYRILVLGDSLVWSGETSSGELYTEVLEGRLNARVPNGPISFEVINAGIPGYTTYQELEFLKIYGVDMEPDLVMLGFVFNDVYYKYLAKPMKQDLLREPSIHLYRFNPDAFPGTFFARSYLVHTIVRRGEVVWKRIFRHPEFPFEQRWDFYLAWKEYGWIHVRRLIGEMQALLTDRGISLAVLVFPSSDQVNDRYRALDEAYVLYPQKKIREICDDYTISILDLTESIYKNGGVTLFRDHLHLNAIGNDVVTDELEEYLVHKLGL